MAVWPGSLTGGLAEVLMMQRALELHAGGYLVRYFATKKPVARRQRR
ncbi:hypothetical protein [Candidatus Laterigemmans baculatus]|nr:hypothetical protein [Candidatus Laterigemmans baculatus]